MNADILKKVKVELQSVKGSDLQTLFEARFPDYAKRMKKAAAKGSQHDEYEKIVEEARHAYQKACVQTRGLTNAVSLANGNDDEEGLPPLGLNEDLYTYLRDARNGDIKIGITQVLKLLEIAEDYKNPDEFAGLLLTGGIFALTGAAIAEFYTLALEGATTVAACIGALSANFSTILLAIGIVVLVIAIPILYFLAKDAITILLLINDTRYKISHTEPYCKHGDMKQEAGYIGRPMLSNYVPCGMYIASKPILSGYGAMTGYHFYTDPFDETVDPKKDCYIGVECPAAGSNNCYCSFEGSKMDIAEMTNEKNVQSCSCSSGDYYLEVNCNSKKGGTAYYIARILDKEGKKKLPYKAD